MGQPKLLPARLIAVSLATWCLSAQAYGTQSSVSASGELKVRTEWERIFLGYGISNAGLQVCNLDGVGLPEIVTASMANSAHYWHVLRGDGNGYSLVFTSRCAARIGSIAVGDIDGDGGSEVLVGAENKILIHSGATYALLRTITTNISTYDGVQSIRTADVDGDQAVEIVFNDARGTLLIYDASTGSQEFSGANLSEYGLAVGNVDRDSDLEIVCTRSNIGYVLNGRTREIEWTYPAGFGYLTEVGDVDNDGIQEIVAGAAWYSIRIIDADLRSPKFDIPVDLDLAALDLADVDGNGTLEVIYGDGQWGDVVVLNGATGARIWSVANPENGMGDLAVGDTDGDGVNEVLWGTGTWLFAADSVSRKIEWTDTELSGPVNAMDYGDADGDGDPEFMYLCSAGYTAQDAFFVHDARTKSLEYSGPPKSSSTYNGPGQVRHANVDHDPQPEFFFSNTSWYQGQVVCLDGLGGAQKWVFKTDNGLGAASLQIGDVDGDGKKELLLGTSYQHSGAPGNYVYMIDATNGAQLWHTVDLGFSASMVRLANIDSDSSLEIVIGSYDGKLFAYDGKTRLEQLHTFRFDLTALDTVDFDGDGRSELLVGLQDGKIEIRSGADASVIRSSSTAGSEIDSIAGVDLTKDGVPDVILVSDNEVTIRNGAALDAPPLWRSGPVGSSVADRGTMMVGDIDQDGRVEIVLNLGYEGIRMLEVVGGTGACNLPGEGTWTCQITTAEECAQLGGQFEGIGSVCTEDLCPDDPDKIVPGVCGCSTPDIDTDGDGTFNCVDGCPYDSAKIDPGTCGCGIAETDSDGDSTPDCADACPLDSTKTEPGTCGCGVADVDTDGDGTLNCFDGCPNDPAKLAPGLCGCGVPDTDSDGDLTPNCLDGCPNDPAKLAPGQCGCGTPDVDSDGDGQMDCFDGCPLDPGKIAPGQCGCGVADTDGDGDGVADCNDRCDGGPDADSDGDGTLDCEDGCPSDPLKTAPGACGCGKPDTDSDNDGTANCIDGCPNNAIKTAPGQCGCNVPDTDSDGDGTADCLDGCPKDRNKLAPGICGCGSSDADSDSDGVVNCLDVCMQDAAKTSPGQCGCGIPDTDSDGDKRADCLDQCPNDPKKTAPGRCGCGSRDVDSDGDGTLDCVDACPADKAKSASAGQCGCGAAETDRDSDGTPDCVDACPADRTKTTPGACGCGVPDTDSDGDGSPDCLDGCPNNAGKLAPGACGCGVADRDTEGDGVADCVDNCPQAVNAGQADTDGDGAGDACDAPPPADDDPDDTDDVDSPGGTGTPPAGNGDPSPEPAGQDQPEIGAPVCGAGLAEAVICLLATMGFKVIGRRQK